MNRDKMPAKRCSMGKVLPFVVPLNEAKLAEIKFAEKLLANETAIKKARFGTDQETIEFAIFPASGEIVGACLTRDTEGKIVDGFVKQFTEPDGFNWFQKMEKRML